jgi:hypothetical protein
MNQAMGTAAVAPAEDVVTVIQQQLEQSSEPMTIPRLRAALPARYRSVNLEDLLDRQVAASVLYRYPRHRSSHVRYWDRPMPVHVAELIGAALRDGPLPKSELRRKLPAYAQPHVDSVIDRELAAGRLHRHPRRDRRGSDRLGSALPDPRDYLRPELAAVFARLASLGFAPSPLRQAAIELLHEEEWE